MKPLCVLVAVVSASYIGNLNYASPSFNHPSLGISVSKVVKRNDPTAAPYEADKLNFTHGVASGDPYAHSVILWTRLSPIFDNDKSNVTVSGYVPLYSHETEHYIKISRQPICADWQVSDTSDFSAVAASGRAYTTSDIDFTIKTEAKNLKPYTTYYYQFRACGSSNKSPIGRTKTAPAQHDFVTRIKLAVYSCSNFPFGFFNAFGNSARKDSVDYVLHLGDYYYEYKDGDYGYGQSIGRVPLPDREIYTLYDYRKRVATYRTDLDLLLSHQQFAWIPVWDDHEVSDNTYRDGASELNNTEASFVKDGGVSVDQRKMNAVRAYFEWMPIRQVDMDDNLRVWRSFSLGSLLDLVILDTRHYDRSITDLYWNTHYVHQLANDAGRSMMGARQEHWFYDALSASANRGAAWRIIGSQTVFSRMNESAAYGNVDPFDYDAWDGYQSNRNRTLSHLYQNSIPNNIFISGDSHMNWVSDLVWLDNKPYDPTSGNGAIGVEFAGTAVSSPSPFGQNVTVAQANNGSEFLVNANQELQWQEGYYRGYFELSIGYDSVEASYFGLPTIVTRNSLEIPLGNGIALNGFLKGGQIAQTNATNDTSVPGGRWSVSSFPVEDV